MLARSVLLNLAPGDCALFHPHLYHRTGGNRSERHRRVMTMHIASARCRSLCAALPDAYLFALVRGTTYPGCLQPAAQPPSASAATRASCRQRGRHRDDPPGLSGRPLSRTDIPLRLGRGWGAGGTTRGNGGMRVWRPRCARCCCACRRRRTRRPPAPEGYEALVTRAVAEFEARNFAEARALFLQAHALQPTARTLRGIGVTEFELRNYVDSVMRLEEALASKVRPLEGELRGQTEAALERARAFVGRIDVKVRPKAASVRVLVDGVPVEKAPEESVTLAVGEHVLQVQAPGYEEEKRTLSVKSGEPHACSWSCERYQRRPRIPVLRSRRRPCATNGTTTARCGAARGSG